MSGVIRGRAYIDTANVHRDAFEPRIGRYDRIDPYGSSHMTKLELKIVVDPSTLDGEAYRLVEELMYGARSGRPFPFAMTVDQFGPPPPVPPPFDPKLDPFAKEKAAAESLRLAYKEPKPAPKTEPVKKEEPNMSTIDTKNTAPLTKVGAKDRVKNDMHEAAYRSGTKKIVKVSQGAIVKMLRKQGANDRFVSSVTNFMSHEIGEAALAVVAGNALAAIPAFANDKRGAKLAEEMRIQGLATVMTLLLDAITKEIDVSDILKNLPAVEG